MATVTKRLCMAVGSYTSEGKVKTEYRDIGVEIEFENRQDGNKWTEIQLNADILNPVLFQLARQEMEKGTSSVRVKKFDVSRKSKTPDTADNPPEFDDDGQPF